MATKPQKDTLDTSLPPHKKHKKDALPEVTLPQTRKPEATKKVEEPRSISDLVKIYYNRPEQGVVREGTDEAPSVYLSRFGLKTPEALDKFLRTPAGKEVITEMTEELAVEKSLEDNRRLEQREHDLLVRRIKIAIFLYFIEKEAHASDKIKEWIRDQIEKKLEPKAAPKETLSGDAQRQANLHTAIAQYTQAISKATSKQSSLKEEEESLLAALAALEKQSEQLIAKYGLYEEHMHDYLFAEYMNTDGTFNPDAIEKGQAELEAAMAALYDRINEVVENDDDPSLLIQEQTALNLKFATLHNMLSVHKGTMYYADEHGTPTSFDKAAFILHMDDQLIYENGQYYLLKPLQNWNTVKDNPEARHQALQQAKENFDRSKNDILTVKKVVHHNHGIEETAHNKKVDGKQFALNVNNAEQRLVENQIRLLQSARSEAQAALTAPTPSNRPQVNPSVTMHSAFHHNAPRPSPQPTISSYKKELEELRKAKELTQTALLALAGKAPGAANQADARLFIENLFKGAGQGLRNLPGQYRDLIIQKMAQFGVETPLTHQNEVQQSTYKTPTPFDDPYK